MKPTTYRFSVLFPSIAVLFSTGAFIWRDGDNTFDIFSQNINWIIPSVLIFFFGLVSFIISRVVIQRRTGELTTKNRELKSLLDDRTTRLEATTKELDAFAYSVSHDLRSPLRTMMAYTEILLAEHSDDLNDEGKLYQQRVRANAERLDLFIDDILTYSGLSSQVVEREPVDMEELTREAISELERKIADRQVNFSVGSLPPADADLDMIRVVIINLIDNAIKFTDNQEAAEIKIGYQKVRGSGSYFVQDNGIGLDMKFSETIFKTFQRLHGVDQYGGSGIGLALVKRIISRHGGRVWVEAEEGKGAVFSFTLGE